MRKKTSFLIYPLLIMGVFLVFVNSCKKDEDKGIPVLTTTAVTDITPTTAKSGGNITSDGGATVTARGVCWSTGQTPTISDNKTTDGTGAGNFVSIINGLSANTTYYVRAYATNIIGTSYGNVISFTTSIGTPTVVTSSVYNISLTTATCSGSISSDGGSIVTARGVCWSTSPNPTINDNKTTDGTGIGLFYSELTGLEQSTTYYVRAYATNSEGTAYGDWVIFTTSAPIQDRLDNGETPKQIYDSGIGINLLYGKTYQGGLIFHFNPTTGTGLIAAPSNQTFRAKWGCYEMGAGFEIDGADGTLVGTGSQNTADILADCSEQGIAARICDNLVFEGYSDWFLPSIGELSEMYQKLKLQGYDDFIANYYWSSTEFTPKSARYYNFIDGNHHYEEKYSNMYFRPVRAF